MEQWGRVHALGLERTSHHSAQVAIAGGARGIESTRGIGESPTVNDGERPCTVQRCRLSFNSRNRACKQDFGPCAAGQARIGTLASEQAPRSVPRPGSDALVVGWHDVCPPSRDCCHLSSSNTSRVDGSCFEQGLQCPGFASVCRFALGDPPPFSRRSADFGRRPACERCCPATMV